MTTRAALLAFLRKHRLCVQASTHPGGAPQAAVVGFAVSDELELVFDTMGTSRKGANLRRDPRTAIVIGWDDEQSAQIEGLADEPAGQELARLKAVYFSVYPDGVARQAWKDITWVRVVPHWIRFSDFREGSRIVVEWDRAALDADAGRVVSRG